MINLKFNKRLRSYPSYGLLYNWYAVNDSRGLAPEGWHVPAASEYTVLYNLLSPYIGRKLKEIGLVHWNAPNWMANNSSGFIAFGGGHRSGSAIFEFIGIEAIFWTATSVSGTQATNRTLLTSDDSFTAFSYYKKGGNSIRCIRDISTGWIAGEQITDYDGNIYDTVQIGTQIWLRQNLAVTHYKDGTAIPEVTDNVTWAGLLTGALCSYNNDWNDVFRI